MHFHTLNVDTRKEQQRGRNPGCRKCNCCPFGYHLDLDFVRYCEKVANSQLLLSPRKTLPRTRVGRKKRESIESLLGLLPDQPQAKTEATRKYEEEETKKGLCDELEKAVSDFEKIFRSSSEAKNVRDNHIAQDRLVKLDVSPVKRDDGMDLPNFTAINHYNGTNNDIRQQMAASLNKMRQLEEQVKLIPNLQNQLKKLRWENRRLVKLLEIKSDEKEKAQNETKVEQKEAIHTRTIGTGCSVLRRDVGTTSHVLLTNTGTDPPHIERSHQGTDPPPLERSHQGTNTESNDVLKIKRDVLNVYVQTDRWHKKPFTMDFGIQVDIRPVMAPKVDAIVQYESPPKVPPLSVGCQFDCPIKKITSFDKAVQAMHYQEKISTRSKSVQSEKEVIKTTTDNGTQVDQLWLKSNRKEFGAQFKPLLTDVGINAKFRFFDSNTQTDRISVKEVGFTVNTIPPSPTKNNISTNTDSIKIIENSPAVVSRFTDTNDLRKTVGVSVNTTKINLVNTSVGTEVLKITEKPEDSTATDRKKVLPTKPKKEQNTTTKTSLQHLKSHEKVSSVEEIQEKISSVASVIPKPYEKKEPSKEMKGAMKVLNDNLLKSPSGEMPRNMKNAVNIIQQEWFKISSTADANPLDVEDYLDCFEVYSVALLEYIVNMTDVSGNTAMHYAVSNGNFDVVSILLDSKVCNINKLNTAGYTSIMLVALTKVKSETDRQVVRRLFHVADVNIRARQHGQTALMLAVSHGRIDTVELLLESGADINIQDEDGSTALMCAAEHGYIDIVKLLLAQPDCDLSLIDLDGNTALNIAMEAGNRDIGVLLYAQEHFARGASPFGSLKFRRAKSATPTLKTPTPTPPNCSQEHSL